MSSITSYAQAQAEYRRACAELAKEHTKERKTHLEIVLETRPTGWVVTTAIRPDWIPAPLPDNPRQVTIMATARHEDGRYWPSVSVSIDGTEYLYPAKTYKATGKKVEVCDMPPCPTEAKAVENALPYAARLAKLHRFCGNIVTCNAVEAPPTPKRATRSKAKTVAPAYIEAPTVPAEVTALAQRLHDWSKATGTDLDATLSAMTAPAIEAPRYIAPEIVSVPPCRSIVLAPRSDIDYLDSDEGTLEPYLSQTALLARVTRYAQNAVAVVALAVIPALAVIGCAYRTNAPMPEPIAAPIAQTAPRLIETDVTDYRAPVKFTTTKGDASWNLVTWKSKNGPKRAKCGQPFALTAKRQDTARIGKPTKSQSFARAAAQRTSARSSTKKLTPRHKSAHLSRYSAKLRHHKRLHRLQRIQRSVPAVVGGAYFVAYRYSGGGPIE